jgi:hypothetical protein
MKTRAFGYFLFGGAIAFLASNEVLLFGSVLSVTVQSFIGGFLLVIGSNILASTEK